LRGLSGWWLEEFLEADHLIGGQHVADPLQAFVVFSGERPVEAVLAAEFEPFAKPRRRGDGAADLERNQTALGQSLVECQPGGGGQVARTGGVEPGSPIGELPVQGGGLGPGWLLPERHVRQRFGAEVQLGQRLPLLFDRSLVSN